MSWLVAVACGVLASATAGAAQSPDSAVAQTSEALIDRAQAARQIDEETASKYRVFAAYGDARLPAQFHGADDGQEEVPAASLARVHTLLPTFSAQTRAELEPFFLRPASPGSWVQLAAGGSPAGGAIGGPAGGATGSPAGSSTSSGAASGAGAQAPIVWRSVPAVGGKVRVWSQDRYPGDEKSASDIAAALTSTIWPKLVGLFGEPLRDDVRPMIGGGTTPVFGDHGPDGALDIYLVHYPGAANKGETRWVERSVYCSQSPRYITIESRRPLGGPSSDGMLQTVAHELTHAINHAKVWLNDTCEEYNWILEATGKWAEDFVYPRAQSEHPYAKLYLKDTSNPLNYEYNVEDKRHYGVYLLPFHLMNHGHQLAMPAMWDQFATMKSLDGVNAALGFEGTSLENVFPRFALENWNRGSVDDYRSADKLTEGASLPKGQDPLALNGSGKTAIALKLPYLSADYRYYEFKAGVKSVTFTNELRGDKRAEVWAVERIKGQWQPPRDLTNESGVTWCRDRPAEDLEELVLVFSNKAWPRMAQPASVTSLRVDGTSTLQTFGTGCTAWVGTASVDYEGGADWTLRESAVASVRFEPNPDLTTPGSPPEYWRAVSGTVKWSASASGRCRGSFDGSLPLGIDPDKFLTGNLNLSDTGLPFTPPAPRLLTYSIGVGPIPEALEPRFTFRCDGISLPTTLTMGATWLMTNPAGHQIPEGTTTLAGTYALPGLTSGTTLTWIWNLKMAP